MADSPRDEAIRKLIHLLLSLVAASIVAWLPPISAAVTLAAATLVALAIELARGVSPRFGDAFRRRLGPLLRNRESAGLTGASTLAIGYTAAAVLLPGAAALTGILAAGVADSAAAVVGRRYGRIRYPGGKSVEGSATFFVVALGLAMLAPAVPIGPALALAAAATLIEAFTLPVDDNLYLPLAVALVARAAGALWGLTFFS